MGFDFQFHRARVLGAIKQGEAELIAECRLLEDTAESIREDEGDDDEQGGVALETEIAVAMAFTTAVDALHDAVYAIRAMAR